MNRPLASVRENLRLVYWLLGQKDKFQELYGCYETFVAAESLRGKWQAVSDGGFLLCDVQEAFPAAALLDAEPVTLEMVEARYAEVSAAASATAVNLPSFEKVLEMGVKYLPLILGLLRQFKG